MASIKRLKKEVDYLVSELVVDCLSYLSLHSKADKEKGFKIIEDTLAIRNHIRDLANHPDGKDDPKLVKAHYRKTIEEFAKGIEDNYKRLEKLTGANA